MTLLEHLEIYPEDWDGINSWLKKGKVYNTLEKNFSPLVTVNNILENTSNSKKSAIKQRIIAFKHQMHNISQAYSGIS
ncbi:MAG: hypothetical protein ACFFAU_07615 [Candidatus Hodarchaeota archaeon]